MKKFHKRAAVFLTAATLRQMLLDMQDQKIFL